MQTFYSKHFIAFATGLFLSLLLGCKKDAFETAQNPSVSTAEESSIAADRNPITKEEAKSWFRNQYGDKKHIYKQNGANMLEFDIKPVWAFSSNGVYGTSTPIVMAPVQRITPFDFGKQGAYFLLFYKDSLAVIQARLVVCIGDDTYSSGTKPKTLSDFSGLVIKMDFQGEMQQKVSVMKAGHHFVDILPNPNALGTTWAYVSPFTFDDNSGGSGGGGLSGYGWFDPTYMHWDSNGNLVIAIDGLHIFTFYGPFAGNNNGGSGGNGGNGSNTGNPNTGNALEQYHFTNLYTNPMFQISEYFENMNLNGEAYQIFGFLNTEGKQFLANEQNFIDVFYEYLEGHNHSASSRVIVAQIIAQILLLPSSQVAQLITLQQALNLSVDQIGWLSINPVAIVQISNFVASYPNAPHLQEAMQAHLDLLMNSNELYQQLNLQAGYPDIGTEAWAETFKFDFEGMGVLENANNAEIALTLSNLPISAIAALLINSNVPVAREKTAQVWGGSGLSFLNHKPDAFRHAYWLALNTKDIGSVWTWAFSEAHETSTPPELSLETDMDRFNNGVGISKSGLSIPITDDEFVNIIQNALLNGELRYLSPLDFDHSPRWPNGLDGMIPGTQLISTNQ